MSLNVKRTVEQGHIRQNFSHGRSKSVLVETKRKRLAVPGLTEEPQPQKAEPAPPKPQPRVFQKPSPDQARDKRPQKVLRELSAGEMDARARALVEARKREDVEKREREIDGVRQAEEAKLREIEEQKRRTEEDAQRKVEEEAERLRAAAEAEEAAKAPKQDKAPKQEEPVARAPAPSRPQRRVGPDSFRVIATPQTERRQQATPPRDTQQESAPAARDGERGPVRRDATGREGPRGPARDGARPGAAAGASARPGFGARPGAGAGPKPAPALDASGRPERVHIDGAARTRADSAEEERRVKRGIPGKAPERAAPAKKTTVERTGRQRLTLSNALNEEQKERSLASLKRQRERQKLQALGTQQERVKI